MSIRKKEERKYVINELLERGVCFAVCVAAIRFVSEEIHRFSKEYSVIINKCDMGLIEEFKFYQTEGYKQLCELKLSPDDIVVFRENMKHFVKVLHNADGRVYELCDMPFKPVFDSILRRIRNTVL